MNSALLELHPASILLPLGLCKWRRAWSIKPEGQRYSPPLNWLHTFHPGWPFSMNLSHFLLLSTSIQPFILCSSILNISSLVEPKTSTLPTCRCPCFPTSLRHLSTSHLQTQSYAINSLHLFKCSLHLKAMVMYSQCFQSVLCTFEQMWRHAIAMYYWAFLIQQWGEGIWASQQLWCENDSQRFRRWRCKMEFDWQATINLHNEENAVFLLFFSKIWIALHS